MPFQSEIKSTNVLLLNEILSILHFIILILKIVVGPVGVTVYTQWYLCSNAKKLLLKVLGVNHAKL
jgi:hypothetical protein